METLRECLRGRFRTCNRNCFPRRQNFYVRRKCFSAPVLPLPILYRAATGGTKNALLPCLCCKPPATASAVTMKWCVGIPLPGMTLFMLPGVLFGCWSLLFIRSHAYSKTQRNKACTHPDIRGYPDQKLDVLFYFLRMSNPMRSRSGARCLI